MLSVNNQSPTVSAANRTDGGVANDARGEIMLVGRILLSFLFLYNGYNHFADYEGRLGYAQFKEVPAPSFSVIASGVVLVLGSTGIIAGIYPVISAGALAVFLIGASVLFHDFWNASDEERQNEFNHFLILSDVTISNAELSNWQISPSRPLLLERMVMELRPTV